MTHSASILLSFDIDGTLEVGDPPGPITLETVRHARALGYVVGSASDRVVRYQRALWEKHGLEMDFVGHKHQLDAVRARFENMSRYVHIGDTDVDQHYAAMHGFEFLWFHELPEPGPDGWAF
ncbi:MAG: HAD family hydrolase [Gammaproteobacteria bacterium]|nr:HAD family hydrolase [Gammaproteobacteria bacterium]